MKLNNDVLIKISYFKSVDSKIMKCDKQCQSYFLFNVLYLSRLTEKN